MVRKRYRSGYGGKQSLRHAAHSMAFVIRKNSGEGKKHANKRREAFSARGGVGLHIIMLSIEHCPDGAPRIVIIISRHVTIKIFLNDNRIR